MLNFDAEKSANPANDNRRAGTQEGEKGGGKPPPWGLEDRKSEGLHQKCQNRRRDLHATTGGSADF